MSEQLEKTDCAPLIPLWNASDAEAAFGADITWPSRRDERIYDVPEKFKTIANLLFFNGGTLKEHGLMLRHEVNGNQFYRCLRAILCSFQPPHEVKEAVAGSLLQHYTRPVDEAGAALSSEAQS